MLAITAFFLAIGIFLSADLYKSSLFRADADTIGSVLQRARSRAVNNINESPHGVHVTTSDYTIFEGITFDSSDPKNEFIPIGSGYSFTPATPFDIVFEQLSGEADFNGDIVITNTSKTTTVNINNEGRIDF